VPAQANGATVALWGRAEREVCRQQVSQGDCGKVRKPATIARYLVQVGTAYRLPVLAVPTAAPIMRLELKTMRKRLGFRQKQALALRYKGEVADLADPPKGPCFALLLRATWRDWLWGGRNRALLVIAYDTACHPSELEVIRIWRKAAEIRSSPSLRH